jgi:hypothetical protein
MRTVLQACTLALIGLLPLFGGCAESRAERTFRRVVAKQETVPLPEVRDELQALIKRWPQTKAAVKAQQEIQWIDDLLGAASRGPLLRAFDTVVSYGADGIPGGSGDATDFIIENGKFVYGRKL